MGTSRGAVGSEVSTSEHRANEHLGKRLQEWGANRDAAELAVLAVHGRSQSPEFLRQTAERFGPVSARFYAPEAAQNSWYPYPFLRPLQDNQPQLDHALETLDVRLDQLAGAGFPAGRVVLWGFSQGACLLAQHVLTAPRRVAGIVLFTGGFIGPEPVTVAPEAAEALRGVPVVMRSIEQDPWVSRGRVAETAELLSRAGAEVNLRIDPGNEHVITDEACAAATRLLATAGGGRWTGTPSTDARE